MTFLELKIPPPIVMLTFAVLAWFLARYSPVADFSHTTRTIAALPFWGVSVLLLFSALLAFHKHKTTINPHHIEKASTLVTSGVFNISRNPMYLGMAMLLLAWAIFLASPVAVLAMVLFVTYITRFQILPEEKVMAAKFGDAYAEYSSRVRRWL